MFGPVKLRCDVMVDDTAPPAGADQLQVTILGAEATGRVILARLAGGDGAFSGEIVASARSLRPQLQTLLDGHPEARQIHVLLPNHLGIDRDMFCSWLAG